jgi:hypothetical protein
MANLPLVPAFYSGFIFQRDVGRLDDGAPARFFLFYESRGGGGALALWLSALFEEFCAHFGQLQGRRRIGVDLLHDGLGRAGRRDQGKPGAGDQAGQADLGGIGHIGCNRAASLAGKAQEFHLLGLLEPKCCRDVADEDIDAAGDDVDQGRALALVGHVHHFDARHRRQHLRREVRGRAVALRGVGHLAGIGLGIGDQLLRRVGGQVLAGGDDVGHDRQHGDGHELRPVVGQGLVEVVVDRERAGRAAQQRVAVGLGAKGDLGPDIAAGAGAVVDDHRLVPGARERFGDDAAERVRRSTRREGDNDADLFLRPGRLRKGRRRGQHQQQGEERAHDARHAGSLTPPVGRVEGSYSRKVFVRSR